MNRWSAGAKSNAIHPLVTALVKRDSEQHARFREACRNWAGSKSWDCVLDDLLEAYQASFSSPATQQTAPALAAS
jgi:hypothetical protein